MGLQERGGDGVGNIAFHAGLDHLRLLLSPGQQIDLAGIEDGLYAHGDGADRGIVDRAENLGGVIARGVVEQNQSGSRVDA